MSLLQTVIDFGVAGLCLSLSWLFYPQSNDDDGLKGYPRAYILQNQVTHARLLPTSSAHSFVYPTISMLFSLNALESHSLDHGYGWIFGYGGIRGRLTGLRSSGYLAYKPDDTRSIREKLNQVLGDRGFDYSQVEDAWMMTMPSFMGFEGINPLTVYFCYSQSWHLWLVVLEVHNTFGEQHVYVLEIGTHEDQIPSKGYDHQWTFPRQFHVSPFNDRSGSYTISVVCPSHPPILSSDTPLTSTPRPLVCIRLHTATSPPQLKLTALLRPVTSTTLTSRSLLLALARGPFTLLLSFPRIVYQAYVLHFFKRLDVYVRPEPRATYETVERALPEVRNAVENQVGLGGGIKWQDEGYLERYARKRVEAFLAHRVDEVGCKVSLVSSNPSIPTRTFSPEGASYNDELILYYRTPRCFSVLLLTPSAVHALLLGQDTERVFSASSSELFLAVFTPSPSPRRSLSTSIARFVRASAIPSNITLPIPSSHALDPPFPQSITLVIVLKTLAFLERLEKWIFTSVGARFVPGDEPWGGWERVMIPAAQIDDKRIGSVHR